MSLRATAVSGAKWTAFSGIVTAGLQFVQLTILARLLSPDDFGLMAMLMVVIGFAQAYADMGVSNAIIYRRDITSRQLSSLYWLNLVAGVGMFFLALLATPAIVVFYHEPRLKSLMHWSAVVFLVSPVGQQYQILLQKELWFKPLALCEIGSRIAGFVVAVLAARGGMGVYALISGSIVSSAVLSLVLLFAGWSLHRPRFEFSLSDTRGFISFGLYQMGERSINYFNGNLDKLIIGRLLGADALGYYNLAWNLVVQPVSRINSILTRIAFPVFARLQTQHDALKNGYLKIMRLLAIPNFAALFGMAAVAPVLVPVIFGERWVPAVAVVQILAFVSLFRSVGNPVGSLLLAKGRADLGFKWNLVLLFAQSLGIVLGARSGQLIGVASALLILHFAYFFLEYRFLVSVLIRPCWKSYVGSMLPTFLISSTMGLAVWGLSLVLNEKTGLSPRILLVACTSSGLIYFISAMLITRCDEVAELLKYVRKSR